jgi:hypothetical protein
MMGMWQLLMLVEEVLFVMGLRLLLVCDSGGKCEIGESDGHVESGMLVLPESSLNIVQVRPIPPIPQQVLVGHVCT